MGDQLGTGSLEFFSFFFFRSIIYEGVEMGGRSNEGTGGAARAGRDKEQAEAIIMDFLFRFLKLYDFFFLFSFFFIVFCFCSVAAVA